MFAVNWILDICCLKRYMKLVVFNFSVQDINCVTNPLMSDSGASSWLDLSLFSSV